MTIPVYHVDSFTSRVFEGNPAAVCFPDSGKSAEWMQGVAQDLNLSETAFLQLRKNGDYDLRWFTPGKEVDLCGHATLASAHVLWSTGRVETSQVVRFHSLSGVLTASQRDGWIELDFPAEPISSMEVPAEVRECVGAPCLFAGSNRMDYLVEVESEEVLRGLTPNLVQLARLSLRGLIVSARSSSDEFDFVSRFFAPACGIDEDPVTGSAHCCLGPYWSEKLGKDQLNAFQASRRGGVVKVVCAGERVKLLGQAVTVMAGEWLA